MLPGKNAPPGARNHRTQQRSSRGTTKDEQSADGRETPGHPAFGQPRLPLREQEQAQAAPAAPHPGAPLAPHRPKMAGGAPRPRPLPLRLSANGRPTCSAPPSARGALLAPPHPGKHGGPGLRSGPAGLA